MEPVDKKKGVVPKKSRNGALKNLPHNPLVPGSSPGRGILRILLISKPLRPARIGSRRRDQRTYCPMVALTAAEQLTDGSCTPTDDRTLRTLRRVCLESGDQPRFQTYRFRNNYVIVAP